MTDILPPARPRLGLAELLTRVRPLGLEMEADPIFVAGLRGYYRDTMGTRGTNDRGLYDDAIFLVSPSFFGAYNGNTDPSGRRPGQGFTVKARGMARLQAGVWRVHRFDLHNGKYLALCQRGGPVTVMRDGNPDYPHAGMFGINIHRGAQRSTSSLGCQTIHPGQWDGFIASAVDQAKRYHGAHWNKVDIPYALLDA
jgi:lysozyme